MAGREHQAVLDPSGQWLVFGGVRIGGSHVYLMTLEPGSQLLQLSNAFTCDPHWAEGGSAVYFFGKGPVSCGLWMSSLEFGRSAGFLGRELRVQSNWLTESAGSGIQTIKS